MKGLLLADQLITSWHDLFGENGPLVNSSFEWVDTLMGVLSTIMWVVMALAGAAGGIYAVYVGIKMARADSAEARDENKKRLINIILSIVAVIALILIFNIFVPMIIGAFYKGDNNWDLDGSGDTALQTVVTTVRCLIGR